MSKANEPAYPHLHDSCQRINDTEHWPGFTKREAYAKDFIAAWIIVLGQRWPQIDGPDDGNNLFVIDMATQLGLAQADALLKEIEKPHD